MSLVITLATARRILTQLRHDRRTVALMVLVPTLVMILLYYVIDDQRAFGRFAPVLLCVFPFLVMFLVTSIATLRERTSGTLERLMAMPLGRLDLLLGYGLAFGLAACVQVALALAVSLTWLGLDIPGPLWPLVLVALLDALLGTALGLLCSAFARTEFQAVQLMPVVMIPQVLLGGILVPRGRMTPVLEWISDVLPMSYAIEAMAHACADTGPGGEFWRDVALVAGSAVLALLLGAVTLRRRTP
ncbi:ABC transporter permease [Microbispora triticiradicis]|uniref:Transport permease protein n=3 Tax=Microbispora TaxID=2005 RepID=A0ABY3M5R1_9ACTN|nr:MULTISPECIES: ABC transporter permease [Microbispora]RGA01794.1 ABC transporter permease [Microbispora triticiradicis]TLP66241.1 ABC transporter permease [Microbispora fusca]TYB68025.1 ABC transporter permease subunit [Microbispora tritici]